MFLLALLPLVASAAIGQTLFGKVTRVVDEDTFALKVHNDPAVGRGARQVPKHTQIGVAFVKSWRRIWVTIL